MLQNHKMLSPNKLVYLQTMPHI